MRLIHGCNMPLPSLSLPENADRATKLSFRDTVHKHHGDYIVVSSESHNLRCQTAKILRVNDNIVIVGMAEIPQDAVPIAHTGQHTVISLDMLCAGNCLRYADITANAVVSIATPRPALEDMLADEYDRAYDGVVQQVEVTRMSLGENHQIEYTPAIANFHVFWTAQNFIEHHIEREGVILRYNCQHAADDNKMFWPIQGDTLQIFFPYVKPADKKSTFNHLYVTSISSQPTGDKTWESVQHDGIGVSPEERQRHSLPEGPGAVDIKVSTKYLRYTKLMAGDTVFCEDDSVPHGIVQHVIREHAMRGESEYAVKYPFLDRFVVHQRQNLACANPKCRLSVVHP